MTSNVRAGNVPLMTTRLVNDLDAVGRVTAADLETAAEWCRAYEFQGEDGDDNAEGLARVAAWLDAEAQRRRDAAAVREIARATGATPAQARAALANVRAR